MAWVNELQVRLTYTFVSMPAVTIGPRTRLMCNCCLHGDPLLSGSLTQSAVVYLFIAFSAAYARKGSRSTLHVRAH